MRLTFDQLVDELDDRPSEDLARIAELATHYAIERRRTEIAENIRLDREEWQSGKLTASDNAEELMRSIEDGSISPMIARMIGILPKDMHVDAARMEYLTQKHLRNND
ncbi:MAG TPA: hypothetical protein VFD13_01785 [Candidatus Kapabacteria bacterium]|nr:hypothetical protein [Candidatus Kapabacteria bacterium]